jgi:hypothetical protein
MVKHTIHGRVWLRPAVISSVLSVITLLAVLTMPLGSGGVAYAAPNTAAIAPDIDVGPVTPTATAGGTLMYKIQVHNDNTASEDLTRVDVTIRYDPNTLTLIDSKLRDKNDWVSKVDGGKVTVQFGKIDQQDERSATLIFQVNPAVAAGAPILADASFDWRTADADGAGGLAIDNVIAVSSNVPVPAATAPNAGPVGTTFEVVATGFQAHEQVVTWLNTSTAVKGLPLSGKANAAGDIQMQFDTAGLAPGYYGLVLHGLDSGREYLLPLSLTG